MTEQPTFDPRRSHNIRSMLVSEARIDNQRGGSLAKRSALLVSLVVAALLLSGGGVALALTGNIPFLPHQEPSPISSASPVPSETPTPSPTPTPTPTPTIDLSDPASWTISANAVGPVTRGMDRTAAGDVLSAAFTTEPYQCDVDVYSSTVSRMQIVVTPEADGTGVASILISGAGDAASPSPKTKEGIGLDSIIDQIVTAYPDIQPPTPNRYPWYSLHQLDGSWIDFEIDRDTQQVLSIFIGDSDYPPPEYCG
jgi:hypothetical protein